MLQLSEGRYCGVLVAGAKMQAWCGGVGVVGAAACGGRSDATGEFCPEAKARPDALSDSQITLLLPPIHHHQQPT